MSIWFTLFFISCNIINRSLCKTLIDKVHVVFSNHLDVGYHRGWDLDSCAWNDACNISSVLNQYWHIYWPLAIAISKEVQNNPPNITFNYMTFPYMMSLYLDCDEQNKMNLKCPTKEQKDYVLQGVTEGRIWFNAFPFNAQLEEYDASLLQFGVQLSYDTMNKTALPIEWHSTVISQRDVPGLPRNMIPTLVQNGIRAVSVGANGGTPILINHEVSNIFKWLDPNSKKQIFVLYHAKGYGGFKIRDALIVPGFNEALVYAWNSDNVGPFEASEIMAIYGALEEEFKAYNEDEAHHIQITSSTFDHYLDALLSFPNKSVVQNIRTYSGEIGDRWSYGIQSDPFKNAAHRNIMKLRRNCLKQNKCSLSSPAFYNFSRLLLKNGEHTWGASTKKALDEAQNAKGYSTYYNDEVLQMLSSNNSVNNFTQMRRTWYEQRDYGLAYAVEALSYSNDANDIDLYHRIQKVLNGRLHNVSIPELSGFTKVMNKSTMFELCDRRYTLQFNESNGAISWLYDHEKDVEYANGVTDHNIGLFWYQSVNQSLKGTPGKITLPNVYITSALVDLYQNTADGNRFVIEMRFGTERAMRDNLCANYSCIERIYNEVQISCDKRTIEMNLKIINKTLTRVPETLFFSFVPYKCVNWSISSYGSAVRLNDVVGSGSWNVFSYGIDGNVSCRFVQNESYLFNVESIDVGLTSWKPVEYPDPMAQGMYAWANGYLVNSSQTDGFAFELFNNMWSTNYPQWYPFDPIDKNITYNVIMHL
eukprot:212520_1